MIDRRKRLQEFLDKNYPGWVATRPWTGDDNVECTFQQPDENKEAIAAIPRKLFDDGDWHQIQRLVRRAISNAVVKS